MRLRKALQGNFPRLVAAFVGEIHCASNTGNSKAGSNTNDALRTSTKDYEIRKIGLNVVTNSAATKSVRVVELGASSFHLAIFSYKI